MKFLCIKHVHQLYNCWVVKHNQNIREEFVHVTSVVIPSFHQFVLLSLCYRCETINRKPLDFYSAFFCLVFNFEEKLDHYFGIYWRAWDGKSFQQQVNNADEFFLVCNISFLHSAIRIEKLHHKKAPLEFQSEPLKCSLTIEPMHELEVSSHIWFQDHWVELQAQVIEMETQSKAYDH